MALEKIREINQSIFSDIVEFRQHMHRFPELSWEESNTATYVESILEKHQISFSRIAVNGVVAIIHGNNPSKKCIALRADMDALPIHELSTAKYCSTIPNVMHACGHDAHTASLLGTAIILNTLKSEWEGSVKLIFQPSEEKQPSGAKAMIDAGVLINPKVDAILGQHVTPELEVGKIGYRAGKFMASADELYIKVIGKGGHAASPHKCIDPILIASHIVIALQQLVSRNASPIIPTVLSIGDISGKGATNIIPDFVEMKGTLRTFDEKWRSEMHQKIVDICESIATGMGGKVEVHIPPGIPYVENNIDLTNQFVEFSKVYLGEDKIVEMDIRMGAEDFSYYTHQVPAFFYRLGTGNISKGITANIHTPNFDIDEDAFKHSSGLMAFVAMEMLKK